MAADWDAREVLAAELEKRGLAQSARGVSNGSIDLTVLAMLDALRVFRDAALDQAAGVVFECAQIARDAGGQVDASFVERTGQRVAALKSCHQRDSGSDPKGENP